MPRYIDADVILTKFDKALQLARNDGAIAALKFCKEIAQKAPTISPDEVRGVGMWIPLDYSDEAYGNMYKCAKCGCSEIGEPNYCPNCGAKMEVSG